MFKSSSCMRLFFCSRICQKNFINRNLHLTRAKCLDESTKNYVVNAVQFILSKENLSPAILKLGKHKNQAAVLVPLCKVDDTPCLLFTVRSNNLPSHKGQVSFPGGGVNQSDKYVTQAALRETEEEIGFPRDKVDVWTTLPPLFNQARSAAVFPVIGYLGDLNLNDLVADANEVAEIFAVPLTELEKAVYRTRFRFNAKKCSENDYTMPIYAVQHKIWGLTAVIVDTVLSIMNPFSYKQVSRGGFILNINQKTIRPEVK
uniref:Nudix hydrolase domain-containing protein n=1 Tax=Ciona savignyi TaxID=51511 RepID=H2YDW8_CIOSA